MAFNVPEKYRVREGILASTQRDGNNGFFIIPIHDLNKNTLAPRSIRFGVQASDGMGWEHLSVSLIHVSNKGVSSISRCPSWEEMCLVKEAFWDQEDAVMQLHPPESMYVSDHPYVLHLWRPTQGEIPLPQPIMVGRPGMKRQNFSEE